jgi:hypothetical protein
MSTPLYSLEESLERSLVQTLQGITALAGLRIVPADRSDETDLPMVSVRAERMEELTLGTGTWQMRLAATLASPADETDAEEIASRRMPDTARNDGGATQFAAEWKLISAVMSAPALRTSLNTPALIHVWGVEQEPVSYENAERTFRRTASVRCWCNPVAPS